MTTLKRNMSTTLTFVLLFSFPAFFANIHAQQISSNIQHITIFPSKANIRRISNFSINKGTHKIILSGLSPYIDASTIQVQSDRNYNIVNVEYSKNYQLPLQKSKEAELLQQKIKKFE